MSNATENSLPTACARKGRTLAIALVVATVPVLPGCITDANRCPDGLLYAPQYEACVTLDAGAQPGPEASLPADAAVPGEGGGSGLGKSCDGEGDCTGQAASYCLKSPLDPPGTPGICTIKSCTATDCGAQYTCCDCSAAQALLGWPAPVCAPIANKNDLVTLAGCICP